MEIVFKEENLDNLLKELESNENVRDQCKITTYIGKLLRGATKKSEDDKS